MAQAFSDTISDSDVRNAVVETLSAEYSRDEVLIAETVENLARFYDKPSVADGEFIPSKLNEFREFYKYTRYPTNEFTKFKTDFTEFEKEVDSLYKKTKGVS
jgi:hypothetical protein